MKVLRLTAYFTPEVTAGEHLSNDLCEAMAKNNMYLECYTPMPTRGISEETRKEYKKEKKKEKLYNGFVEVKRYSMFKEGKSPLQRAVRYGCCSIVGYIKAIKSKNVDVVYSSSTPPTQGMLSALVAKRLSKKYKKHVPFIFNLQDIFPESLVYTGLCKESSILYKLGDKIMNYTYKNADKIIVISEEFKNILLRKGIFEEKIEVVYNWIDEKKIQYVPREDNKLFDEYNLDRDKFYVAYSGNIGLTQNMDMLLEIADHIKESKNIGIILVGDGAYKETVEKTIKEKSLENVKLIPFQPYERISEVFSLGDMSLIISKKGVAKNSLPSKTWGYMSAKRPLLVSFDKDSELTRIIENNKCGVCVEADDTLALEKAIIELSNKDITYLGINGRKYIKNNLTKAVCTKKYVDILKWRKEL